MEKIVGTGDSAILKKLFIAEFQDHFDRLNDLETGKQAKGLRLEPVETTVFIK